MPLLADICRSLVGPDCGAAYPAQIERVLLRILGAEEAAEFGGPADVVAAFKSARLTPGSLVGVCANLPAPGGQGAPRGVALAVCFAACFYPRRAYTLEPEELAAHVAAFAFFDGCPARLVPDNLGSGVLKADLYDPRLNRGYAEL